MKKRVIAFLAIMAIAASMAGCGKKTEDKGSNIVDGAATSAPAADGAVVTAEPKTEEQIQDELDNFAKDADKNVDMKKIDGTKLKSSAEAEINFDGYEVEIKDAVKTTDADGAPVVVVEFEFENKTSMPTKFASVISADASQGERVLPAAVTYEAEGFEGLTIAQDVDTNEEIKVQKAYKLVSDTDPIVVTVKKADTVSSADVITKTFELN